MKIDLGWAGIWLLVIGAAAVVVELALMGVWSARVARKSLLLSERMTAAQASLQGDVARLQASIAETRELWQPYHRLLRWLRHPIVIALLGSYSRRRAK